MLRKAMRKEKHWAEVEAALEVQVKTQEKIPAFLDSLKKCISFYVKRQQTI